MNLNGQVPSQETQPADDQFTFCSGFDFVMLFIISTLSPPYPSFLTVGMEWNVM